VLDTDLAVGLLWFLAFLFSTTVHEAMHAFVAWKGGDPTAYHGGQVSLSPIPHIKREPIGMLAVPLLTSLTQGWAMGWASAPYDPLWAERHPQRAALMAAAGPAGNLLIAVVAFAGLKAGLMAGWFVAPERAVFHSLVANATTGEASFLGTVLSVLLMLNVFVGLFNLLPLPPLDGFSVVTIFMPEERAQQLRRIQSNPSASMVGLVIAWQIFPLITHPLFTMVLKLVHPDESYSSFR
jgi:Zn-dependent protease